MSQIATTIRMDSDLKNAFDSLCAEFGMSVNTAFNIFAKAVVRSRSIPFKIELDNSDISERLQNVISSLRNASSDIDFSSDEIDAEIKEYRKGN